MDTRRLTEDYRSNYRQQQLGFWVMTIFFFFLVVLLGLSRITNEEPDVRILGWFVLCAGLLFWVWGTCALRACVREARELWRAAERGDMRTILGIILSPRC